MRIRDGYILLFFFQLVIILCVGINPINANSLNPDPLLSWRNTATKGKIIKFVEEITNPASPYYQKPENRIAVFDNDGTLWCEKPLDIHVMAALDRARQLAGQNSLLKNLQPYKAIVNNDTNYFKNLHENCTFDILIGQLMAVPFGGMTASEYEAWCKEWLTTWKHPDLKVGYEKLVYKPMVELIHYLRANDFKVYIFTADEDTFLRLVSEELYGIPPENVQGSTIEMEYIVEGTHTELIRTFQVRSFNNWAEKSYLIHQILGKRPIFAAGNSNGDLHMLQYVAGQNRRSLAMLVHHTDGEREYQYDTDAEKVLPLAQKCNWTVVDMKNDWNLVFERGDQ